MVIANRTIFKLILLLKSEIPYYFSRKYTNLIIQNELSSKPEICSINQ